MPTGPVNRNDDVTRFVFQGSSVRSNGTVKGNAFYPNDRGRCSVAVTTQLSNAEIDAYANAHVVPQRRLPVVAYATIRSAVAWDLQLDVQYSEPPPKHANIQGFKSVREDMMSQAQQLAKDARVRKV